MNNNNLYIYIYITCSCKSIVVKIHSASFKKKAQHLLLSNTFMIFKDSAKGWSLTNIANCSHVASALISKALVVRASLSNPVFQNFKTLSICFDLAKTKPITPK